MVAIYIAKLPIMDAWYSIQACFWNIEQLTIVFEIVDSCQLFFGTADS
jgi:hypothetical protein